MPSKRPKSQNRPVQLPGFTPECAIYGCHQQKSQFGVEDQPALGNPGRHGRPEC